MAQEGYSNSSSGGGANGGGGGGGADGGHNHHRCSKKLKQKKVPQRGLGVAQLERIRMEEQQKKDVSGSILSPNSIISPSNSSNCLAIQCPNFRPTMSAPSLPLPPPSPNNLPPIPNMDVLNPPLSSKPMNVGGVGGGEIGWLGGSRGRSWPRLWNGDYNHLDREDHLHHGGGLDHRGGFAFTKNVRLPYESNSPTWPLPNAVQRSQQFQQPCSSSMVNVSTGTSSSSSTSVLNFQMEPPSNQSYCGNNYTPPLWPEEEKMVGMKRSYPFSVDNVPIPSFHCKFPSSYVSPISRSDESASCSNGGTTGIDPPNPFFREGPSSSSAISEPSPKRVVDENGGLNGDFLKLAPPEATVELHLSVKQNQQPSTKLSLHCQELSQFVETLPAQGSKNNPIHVTDRGGSNQQTFLSFFPAVTVHSPQAIGPRSNNNGEIGESVDLNLKL